MSLSISPNSPNSPSSPTLPTSAAARQTANDSTGKGTSAGDKVTLGAPAAAAGTYADPRKSVQTPANLSAMLEESNRQAQAIIDLIMPLVQQQGLNLAKVVSGEQHLQADPATIEKAKAAIADDGEFGVKQVAERILSFAKAAIGDDPAKLATIRAAVEKGFKQASDILGGTLPEISQKTHDAIFAEFDRWQSEGIPAGDKVSLSSQDQTDTAAPAA